MRANPDTDVAEICVPGASFPHPDGPDDVGECPRIRVAPFQRRALFVAGGIRIVAQVREVAEVVLALFVEFRRGLALSLAATHEHACHRHDHHHRKDHEHRVFGHIAATDGHHERDHPNHCNDHHERHQLHQQIAGNHAWHFRGRLEVHLAPGHSGRLHPCATHETLGAHLLLAPPPRQVRDGRLRRPSVLSAA